MLSLHYLSTASWFLPVRILLSLVYGFIHYLRNLIYDFGLIKTHRVDVPIVSVGNISVGGSGKTILVQALVEYFMHQNKLPAVLSRGYGRKTQGLFVVANTTDILGNPENSGDEPYLIANRYPGIPVIVSEDRFTGAKYLIESFRPDVIILDDGFQHRRLHRDLDLVILDQPQTSKSHLLPWGKLRESYPNLRRASLVLYSKDALKNDPDKNLTMTLEDHLLDHAGNSVSLSSLDGHYGLFAGLGNPDYFFTSILALQGPSTINLAFPDHAEYTAKRQTEIVSHSCDYWITTEKDFIKLPPLFCKDHHIYYIRVSMSLPPALLVQLKNNFNF